MFCRLSGEGFPGMAFSEGERGAGDLSSHWLQWQQMMALLCIASLQKGHFFMNVPRWNKKPALCQETGGCSGITITSPQGVCLARTFSGEYEPVRAESQMAVSQSFLSAAGIED